MVDVECVKPKYRRMGATITSTEITELVRTGLRFNSVGVKKGGVLHALFFVVEPSKYMDTEAKASAPSVEVSE